MHDQSDDPNECKLKLITLDEFNKLRNKICDSRVICMSNICKETNSVFVQKETGAFGQIDLETKYFDEF